MECKIYTEKVGDIELSFMDVSTSWTVPEVFKELRSDRYGLESCVLGKNDIVIDVGGNVGMFSIYANKKFGCKIVAFEPVKENYDNFLRNILINRCDESDFEVYNLAVTDKDDDVVTLGIQEWNSGGSSIYYKNPITNRTIKTVNLNKFINEDCKFLKLDCEGSEHTIIPSILDKINYFENIGIEYHKIEGFMEPTQLAKLLEENFKGKLYPETIDGYISIGSHFL